MNFQQLFEGTFDQFIGPTGGKSGSPNLHQWTLSGGPSGGIQAGDTSPNYQIPHSARSTTGILTPNNGGGTAIRALQEQVKSISNINIKVTNKESARDVTQQIQMMAELNEQQMRKNVTMQRFSDQSLINLTHQNSRKTSLGKKDGLTQNSSSLRMERDNSSRGSNKGTLMNQNASSNRSLDYGNHSQQKEGSRTRSFQGQQRPFQKLVIQEIVKVDGGIQCDFPSFDNTPNLVPNKESIRSGSVITSEMVSPLVSHRYAGQQDPQQLPYSPNNQLTNTHKHFPQHTYNFSDAFKIFQQSSAATGDPKTSHQTVMLIKDGDWIFNISSLELEQFRRLQAIHMQKSSKDQHHPSGIYIQQKEARDFGHIPKNIRPKSANAIHRRVSDGVKEKQREKRIMIEYFEILKKQGKGKLISEFEKDQKQSNTPAMGDGINSRNSTSLLGSTQQMNKLDGYGSLSNTNKVSTPLQQITYTVFKKISRQNRQLMTFHNSNIGSRASSHNLNASSGDQENHDINNSYLNVYSLKGSQDQRPNTTQYNFKRITAPNDYQPSELAQQFSIIDSNKYLMKPVLSNAQHELNGQTFHNGSTKRDASIQNDKELNENLPQSLLAHSFIKQSKVKEQNQMKNTKKIEKPLFIISTNKSNSREKVGSKAINHKGNQMLEYKLQVDELKKARRLSQITEGKQRHISSPNSYQISPRQDFNQAPAIKVQQYNMNIIPKNSEKIIAYKPKYTNPNVIKYYQSNGSNKQQPMLEGNSVEYSTHKKRKFHHKSIDMGQIGAMGNSQLYDTPDFRNETKDYIQMLEGQGQSRFIEAFGHKQSTLELNPQIHLQPENSGDSPNNQSSQKSHQDLSPSQSAVTDQHRKNILLSKKQVHPLSDQQKSGSATSQIIFTNNELAAVAAANNENSEAILLEHIREETCESFDSGLVESSHTMQSNFLHGNGGHSSDKVILKKQISRSFTNALQLMLQKDQTDMNYQEQQSLLQPQYTEMHASLTERNHVATDDFSPDYQQHSYNLNIVSPINHSGYCKSKSNRIDQEVQNQGTFSKAAEESNVIYKRREDMIRIQQQQHQLKRIGTFTHSNLNTTTLLLKSSFSGENNEKQLSNHEKHQGTLNQEDSYQLEDGETRNMNMGQKRSSKASATRVISKIGIQNKHLNVPLNVDSQNSISELPGQKLTLQIADNEGFLEIPRYLQEYKSDIPIQYHESFKNFVETSKHLDNKDSTFDEFPSQTSPLDVSSNTSPFFTKNQQIVVKYQIASEGQQQTAQKSKEDANALPRMTKIVKTGGKKSGLQSIGSVVELKPDVLLPIKQIINDTQVDGNTTQKLRYKNRDLKAEKKQAQMLKRNMSVFRRQCKKGSAVNEKQNKSMDMNISNINHSYNLQNSSFVRPMSDMGNPSSKLPNLPHQQFSDYNMSPKPSQQSFPRHLNNQTHQLPEDNQLLIQQLKQKSHLISSSGVGTKYKSQSTHFTPSNRPSQFSTDQQQLYGSLLQEYLNQEPHNIILNVPSRETFQAKLSTSPLPSQLIDQSRLSSQLHFGNDSQISYSIHSRKGQLDFQEAQNLLLHNNHHKLPSGSISFQVSKSTTPILNNQLSSGTGSQQHSYRRPPQNIFQRQRQQTTCKTQLPSAQQTQRSLSGIWKQSDGNISQTTQSQSCQQIMRNKSAATAKSQKKQVKGNSMNMGQAIQRPQSTNKQRFQH